ncbi:hypothetical protein FO519_007152 [Halicephalobus sp. NKZ332]|nr:hypothetical protein FO519_007152 [Halicephalobus sp. NKZ332]
MGKIFIIEEVTSRTVDVEEGIIRTQDSGPANNEKVYLLNSVQNAIPPKNFFIEIRGILDVEHLLDKAIILLDVVESDLDEIVRRMTDSIPMIRDRILYSDVQDAVFSYSEFQNIRVSSVRQKLQGVCVQSDNVIVDQSWLSIYCSLPGIEHRHVCFARMNLPTNFGPGLGDVQFVVLILAPMFEKNTKSAFETAKTFSTLLSDPGLRQRLLDVNSEEDFIKEINHTVDKMAFQLPLELENKIESVINKPRKFIPFRGILDDFKTRYNSYVSDFTDGIADFRSIQKTISSAVFLYFAILPTAIALGMLNDSNTHGLINVKKEILAQWIGGLFFGIFGGQLFLIMLSTAPISIYIEVIHTICKNGNFDFFKMFTTTGLWCSFFLFIFAVFEFSKIMKYAKRSLEELFGMFISVALIYKAILAIINTFSRYDPSCVGRFDDPNYDLLSCDRSVGLLFVLLLCGTLWISLTLYNFRTTPFLTKIKREILADYSLPIGVIVMSFVGSYCFRDVPKETFTYNPDLNPFTISAFWDQSWEAHLISLGLGIPLAILFFMDQLIVTNTVDNTQNNLKKGAAPNWDLFIVAILNAILSLLGLPWMHGALPQAFLHLKTQADVEDRLVDGTMQQIIVKNRESRLATLICHILIIPTYFFLLPYLKFIPTAVFHGLFVYLALSSIIGNEFFQRVLLFFTEQRSYPPVHYIRRVPQKIVHSFTIIEMIQLIILCFVGFCPWPVVEMIFPIVTFLFIPFRSLVLPKFFKKPHLEALDNIH